MASKNDYYMSNFNVITKQPPLVLVVPTKAVRSNNFNELHIMSSARTYQKIRYLQSNNRLYSQIAPGSTLQLITLLLLSYKNCVYVRCWYDYIIRDCYLKKLFAAQNSAVLLHCSHVSRTGNKQLPRSHDFLWSMPKTMPIRLTQVIYISQDSDAPALAQVQVGWCLNPSSDLQHDSEIMPKMANLCQPDRHA